MVIYFRWLITAVDNGLISRAKVGVMCYCDGVTR